MNDDEDVEVSNKKLSYDNVAQEIKELLNKCKILYKTLLIQKKQISSLKEIIDTMQKYFEKLKQNATCNDCNSLSFRIVHLIVITQMSH